MLPFRPLLLPPQEDTTVNPCVLEPGTTGPIEAGLQFCSFSLSFVKIANTARKFKTFRTSSTIDPGSAPSTANWHDSGWLFFLQGSSKAGWLVGWLGVACDASAPPVGRTNPCGKEFEEFHSSFFCCLVPPETLCDCNEFAGFNEEQEDGSYPGVGW